MTKIIPQAKNAYQQEAQHQEEVENTVDGGIAAGHNDEDNGNDEETTINDGATNNTNEGCLLQFYIDHPISISTTLRWLRQLGFSYNSRKKSFFVDGHERPNVVARRNEFCIQYLSQLEPRTHRWIQVTKQAVEQWKADKTILDDETRGYQYHCADKGYGHG